MSDTASRPRGGSDGQTISRRELMVSAGRTSALIAAGPALAASAAACGSSAAPSSKRLRVGLDFDATRSGVTGVVPSPVGQLSNWALWNIRVG